MVKELVREFKNDPFAKLEAHQVEQLAQASKEEIKTFLNARSHLNIRYVSHLVINQDLDALRAIEQKAKSNLIDSKAFPEIISQVAFALKGLDGSTDFVKFLLGSDLLSEALAWGLENQDTHGSLMQWVFDSRGIRLGFPRLLWKIAIESMNEKPQMVPKLMIDFMRIKTRQQLKLDCFNEVIPLNLSLENTERISLCFSSEPLPSDIFDKLFEELKPSFLNTRLPFYGRFWKVCLNHQNITSAQISQVLEVLSKEKVVMDGDRMTPIHILIGKKRIQENEMFDLLEKFRNNNRELYQRLLIRPNKQGFIPFVYALQWRKIKDLPSAEALLLPKSHIRQTLQSVDWAQYYALNEARRIYFSFTDQVSGKIDKVFQEYFFKNDMQMLNEIRQLNNLVIEALLASNQCFNEASITQIIKSAELNLHIHQNDCDVLVPMPILAKIKESPSVLELWNSSSYLKFVDEAVGKTQTFLEKIILEFPTPIQMERNIEQVQIIASEMERISYHSVVAQAIVSVQTGESLPEESRELVLTLSPILRASIKKFIQKTTKKLNVFISASRTKQIGDFLDNSFTKNYEFPFSVNAASALFYSQGIKGQYSGSLPEQIDEETDFIALLLLLECKDTTDDTIKCIAERFNCHWSVVLFILAFYDKVSLFSSFSSLNSTFSDENKLLKLAQKVPANSKDAFLNEVIRRSAAHFNFDNFSLQNFLTTCKGSVEKWENESGVEIPYKTHHREAMNIDVELLRFLAKKTKPSIAEDVQETVKYLWENSSILKKLSMEYELNEEEAKEPETTFGQGLPNVALSHIIAKGGLDAFEQLVDEIMAKGVSNHTRNTLLWVKEAIDQKVLAQLFLRILSKSGHPAAKAIDPENKRPKEFRSNKTEEKMANNVFKKLQISDNKRLTILVIEKMFRPVFTDIQSMLKVTWLFSSSAARDNGDFSKDVSEIMKVTENQDLIRNTIEFMMDNGKASIILASSGYRREASLSQVQRENYSSEKVFPVLVEYFEKTLFQVEENEEENQKRQNFIVQMNTVLSYLEALFKGGNLNERHKQTLLKSKLILPQKLMNKWSEDILAKPQEYLEKFFAIMQAHFDDSLKIKKYLDYVVGPSFDWGASSLYALRKIREMQEVISPEENNDSEAEEKPPVLENNKEIAYVEKLNEISESIIHHLLVSGFRDSTPEEIAKYLEENSDFKFEIKRNSRGGSNGEKEFFKKIVSLGFEKLGRINKSHLLVKFSMCSSSGDFEKEAMEFIYRNRDAKVQEILEAFVKETQNKKKDEENKEEEEHNSNEMPFILKNYIEKLKNELRAEVQSSLMKKLNALAFVRDGEKLEAILEKRHFGTVCKVFEKDPKELIDGFNLSDKFSRLWPSCLGSRKNKKDPKNITFVLSSIDQIEFEPNRRFLVERVLQALDTEFWADMGVSSLFVKMIGFFTLESESLSRKEKEAFIDKLWELYKNLGQIGFDSDVNSCTKATLIVSRFKFTLKYFFNCAEKLQMDPKEVEREIRSIMDNIKSKKENSFESSLAGIHRVPFSKSIEELVNSDQLANLKLQLIYFCPPSLFPSLYETCELSEFLNENQETIFLAQNIKNFKFLLKKHRPSFDFIEIEQISSLFLSKSLEFLSELLNHCFLRDLQPIHLKSLFLKISQSKKTNVSLFLFDYISSQGLWASVEELLTPEDVIELIECQSWPVIERLSRTIEKLEITFSQIETYIKGEIVPATSDPQTDQKIQIYNTILFRLQRLSASSKSQGLKSSFVQFSKAVFCCLVINLDCRIKNISEIIRNLELIDIYFKLGFISEEEVAWEIIKANSNEVTYSEWAWRMVVYLLDKPLLKELSNRSKESFLSEEEAKTVQPILAKRGFLNRIPERCDARRVSRALEIIGDLPCLDRWLQVLSKSKEEIIRVGLLRQLFQQQLARESIRQEWLRLLLCLPASARFNLAGMVLPYEKDFPDIKEAIDRVLGVHRLITGLESGFFDPALVEKIKENDIAFFRVILVEAQIVAQELNKKFKGTQLTEIEQSLMDWVPQKAQDANIREVFSDLKRTIGDASTILSLSAELQIIYELIETDKIIQEAITELTKGIKNPVDWKLAVKISETSQSKVLLEKSTIVLVMGFNRETAISSFNIETRFEVNDRVVELVFDQTIAANPKFDTKKLGSVPSSFKREIILKGLSKLDEFTEKSKGYFSTPKREDLFLIQRSPAEEKSLLESKEAALEKLKEAESRYNKFLVSWRIKSESFEVSSLEMVVGNASDCKFMETILEVLDSILTKSKIETRLYSQKATSKARRNQQTKTERMGVDIIYFLKSLSRLPSDFERYIKNKSEKQDKKARGEKSEWPKKETILDYNVILGPLSKVELNESQKALFRPLVDGFLEYIDSFKKFEEALFEVRVAERNLDEAKFAIEGSMFRNIRPIQMPDGAGDYYPYELIPSQNCTLIEFPGVSIGEDETTYRFVPHETYLKEVGDPVFGLKRAFGYIKEHQSRLLAFDLGNPIQPSKLFVNFTLDQSGNILIDEDSFAPSLLGRIFEAQVDSIESLCSRVLNNTLSRMMFYQNIALATQPLLKVIGSAASQATKSFPNILKGHSPVSLLRSFLSASFFAKGLVIFLNSTFNALRNQSYKNSETFDIRGLVISPYYRPKNEEPLPEERSKLFCPQIPSVRTYIESLRDTDAPLHPLDYFIMMDNLSFSFHSKSLIVAKIRFSVLKPELVESIIPDLPAKITKGITQIQAPRKSSQVPNKVGNKFLYTESNRAFPLGPRIPSSLSPSSPLAEYLFQFDCEHLLAYDLFNGIPGLVTNVIALGFDPQLDNDILDNYQFSNRKFKDLPNRASFGRAFHFTNSSLPSFAHNQKEWDELINIFKKDCAKWVEDLEDVSIVDSRIKYREGNAYINRKSLEEIITRLCSHKEREYAQAAKSLLLTGLHHLIRMEIPRELAKHSFSNFEFVFSDQGGLPISKKVNERTIVIVSVEPGLKYEKNENIKNKSRMESENDPSQSYPSRTFIPKDKCPPIEEPKLKFVIDPLQFQRGKKLENFPSISEKRKQVIEKFDRRVHNLLVLLFSHSVLLAEDKEAVIPPLKLSIDFSEYIDEESDDEDLLDRLTISLFSQVECISKEIIERIKVVMEPWGLALKTIEDKCGEATGEAFGLAQEGVKALFSQIREIVVKVIGARGRQASRNSEAPNETQRNNKLELVVERNTSDQFNLKFDWEKLEIKMRRVIVKAFLSALKDAQTESGSPLSVGLKKITKLFGKNVQIRCDIESASPKVEDAFLAIVAYPWLLLVVQATTLVGMLEPSFSKEHRLNIVLTSKEDETFQGSLPLLNENVNIRIEDSGQTITLTLSPPIRHSFNLPSLSSIVSKLLQPYAPFCSPHLVKLPSIIIDNKASVFVLGKDIKNLKLVALNARTLKSVKCQVISQTMVSKKFGVHFIKCKALNIEVDTENKESRSQPRDDILLTVARGNEVLRAERIMRIDKAGAELGNKNGVYELSDFLELHPYVIVPKRKEVEMNSLMDTLTAGANQKIKSDLEIIGFINKVGYIKKKCNGAVFLYGTRVMLDYHGDKLSSSCDVFLPENYQKVHIKQLGEDFKAVVEVKFLKILGSKISIDEISKSKEAANKTRDPLSVIQKEFSLDTNPFTMKNPRPNNKVREAGMSLCEVGKSLTIRIRGFNFMNLPISVNECGVQLLHRKMKFVIDGKPRLGPFSSKIFEFEPKYVGEYDICFNEQIIQGKSVDVYHGNFGAVADIDNSLVYLEAGPKNQPMADTELTASKILSSLSRIGENSIIKNEETRKTTQFELAMTSTRLKHAKETQQVVEFKRNIPGALLMKDKFGNPYWPSVLSTPKEEGFSLKISEAFFDGIPLSQTNFLSLSTSLSFTNSFAWHFNVEIKINSPASVSGKTLMFQLSLNDRKIGMALVSFIDTPLIERVKNFKASILQNRRTIHASLNVSRGDFVKSVKSHALSSSVNFANPLTIHFTGEAGYDAGGLRREFYDMLGKFMVSSELTILRYNHNAEIVPTLIAAASPEKEQLMTFIGKIVANSILYDYLLGIEFASAFVKMIYKRNLIFSDLQDILDNTTYDSLMELDRIDAEALDDCFIPGVQVLDGRPYEMMKNGKETFLNKGNLEEFYQGVLKFYSKGPHGDIPKLVECFRKGFNQVFPLEKVTSMFEPEEFNVLLIGSTNKEVQLEELIQVIEVQELPNVTKYFWDFVYELKPKQLEKLVKFITGSHRIKLHDESYKIRVFFTGDRIFSHTCFNQLDLPKEMTKEAMYTALKIVINERNFRYNTG